MVTKFCSLKHSAFCETKKGKALFASHASPSCDSSAVFIPSVCLSSLSSSLSDAKAEVVSSQRQKEAPEVTRGRPGDTLLEQADYLTGPLDLGCGVAQSPEALSERSQSLKGVCVRGCVCVCVCVCACVCVCVCVLKRISCWNFLPCTSCLSAMMQLRLLCCFLISASLPAKKIPSAKRRHVVFVVCSPAFYYFFFVCLFVCLFHLLSAGVRFESINHSKVDRLCTFVLPATLRRHDNVQLRRLEQHSRLLLGSIPSHLHWKDNCFPIVHNTTLDSIIGHVFH